MAGTQLHSCPLPLGRLSAELAVRRLRSLRLTPARRAIDRLNELRDSSRILHLYRRHFPEDFARSTASTVIPGHADEPGHSEREVEFFALVDRHLFPLPEFLFDSERLPSIPVYPQGVDWEEDRENLRLSLGAAMALVSGEEDELWKTYLPSNLSPEDSPRDWEKLQGMCAQANGLTARFPLLLDLVTHGTGNLWLDTSWENAWEDIPWDEKAMDHLINEWRKAQAIWARLDPLLDHIDRHPRYWLRRLVTLWNRAGKFVSGGSMAQAPAGALR